MSIKTQWFKGLDDQQKADFQTVLLNNTTLFRQLLKILKERHETIEKRSYDEETYKTPDWASLEAFRNGKRAELEFLADLIDFSDNN